MEEQIKENSRKAKAFPIEWCAFGIFIVLSMVLYVFHEPCYEEIQAWIIAKQASFYDILFTLPHYEGHPPLWHLILSVFAKTGAPMQLGLCGVAFVFSTLATWLIMFKAPMNKWVRVLIPFTYFFFYQYHILSRPYAIMMLSFVLAAMFYKTRNLKPLRYVAALFLLCLTSAYGILFAACLCLIWTFEIVKELKGKQFIRKACTDQRTWCLVGILVLAILLYLIIAPADNSYAQLSKTDFSKIKCLIYMFFIAPGDALITDISLQGSLQQSGDLIRFNAVTGMCIFTSVLVSFVLGLFAKIYKKFITLAFPYVVFALFGGLVYFYNHHIGIIVLFCLFILWICLDSPPENMEYPKWMQKVELKNAGLFGKLAKLLLYICIVISLFWNVIAYKNEIQYASWYAKDLAAMIQEYDIDDMQVLSQWIYISKNEDGSEESEEGEAFNETENGETMEDGVVTISLMEEPVQKNAEDYYQYVRMCNYVDVLAYCDKNFFYDFNDGNNNMCYVNHNMLSQEESIEYLTELGKKGYPEIIVGNPDVLGMMGLNIDEYSYIPIYNFRCYRINKYNTIYATDFVYAREDIFATRTDWPIFQQLSEDLVDGYQTN